MHTRPMTRGAAQQPGSNSRAFREPFLHVDMDAFFVEVERLRDPSLTGRPIVVGGSGPRGVVASASYEARSRGVRSAMPGAEARRRCPNVIFVPPDHRRYAAVSADVFSVLRSFTPLIEGLSIDEAFLDVSGLRLHFPSSEDVGHAIRTKIREEVGLPASVGVAGTKSIAKLASGKAKPNGLLRIPAGSEIEFLHPLPISDLWGVGPVTEATLAELGVLTIGDLAEIPPGLLEQRVGGANTTHLSALARGEDPREVIVGSAARSISVEETYPVDLVDRDAVERQLLRLCDRLAGRLHRAGARGRSATLKVRFDDFTTVTRSVTLREPIWRLPDIWDSALRLLTRARLGGRPVRLLGVGVAHLVEAADPEQLSMAHPDRDAVSEAAEVARSRFGDGAVVPARLAGLQKPPTLKDERGPPD